MRKGFLLVIILVCYLQSIAQLLSFDFAGITGSEATIASNATSGGVLSSLISRGPGIVSAANADRFNSSGWSTGAVPDADDYLEFIIEPEAAFSLSVTGINILHQRSGTGPVGFVIRTSLDNYSSDAANSITIADQTTTQTSNFIFNNAINTSTAVTIRIYAYAAEGVSGTWGPGDGAGNDIIVNGSVSASGNTITTGVVLAPPFCVSGASGMAGTVAFTSNGNFNTDFVARLSDASGSFTSAQDIGSLSVTGNNPAGNINIVIAAGTEGGGDYKIRIDALVPAIAGSESASFSIVEGAMNINGASVTPGDGQISVGWTNPSACYEEIMIVAKAFSSINTIPSGDGSAYSASLAFGSGTAFDNGFVVYKGTSSPQLVTGLENGTPYYFKFFTRRGDSWSAGLEINAMPVAIVMPGQILINQFSPDYGGAGDEYIELVNTSGKTFDLSTLAIRYQSAGGSNGVAGGVLSGTIGPRQFWLLSPNASITVGLTTALARDGVINAGFTAASGQLALIRVSDNVIIDALGYGTVTGGNYTETIAAPSPPTDGGLKRAMDGMDSDNNSIDMITVTQANIQLRNSANNPLPVKFNRVVVFTQSSGAKIEWSNASEMNISHYELQHAYGNGQFGTIAIIRDPVNNAQAASYSYFHPYPVAGLNFYRVQAVDIGGQVTQSVIVRFNKQTEGLVMAVYPNPVRGHEISVSVNMMKGQYIVVVQDITGVTVMEKEIHHGGGARTELLALPRKRNAGIYMITIRNAELVLRKMFISY